MKKEEHLNEYSDHIKTIESPSSFLFDIIPIIKNIEECDGFADPNSKLNDFLRKHFW